jgi:hypothetical protein
MQANEELDPRWHGAAIPQEHWHFHRQLLARYGIVLAPGEFSHIRKAIKDGTAQLVERRRERQAIYSVRVASVHERIYILACGLRFITAWPPEKRLNAKRRSLGPKTEASGVQGSETEIPREVHSESAPDCQSAPFITFSPR